MSRTARLGLFVFAALLVTAAAIFLIGDRQLMFATTYHLRSEFDSVRGLDAGADVRVGGVRKGTVSSIVLPDNPARKVVVELELEGSTRKLIKKDSVASIKTEGLLGSKFVSVSFGSEGAQPVTDGETIAGEPPLDLTDLIDKTNEIMDEARVALRNVGSATEDMKDITAKINSGRGTIGELVNEKGVYRKLNSLTGELQQAAAQSRSVIADAKTGVTAFSENMEALKHNFFFRGFFKNRGYMDSGDLTRHEIQNIPDRPIMQRYVLDAKQVFDDADTAKLKRPRYVDPIGTYLQTHPYGLAVVAGYGGAKGDSEDVLNLSRARAAVVRDYLVKHFNMDDSLVKTRGMGKQKSPDRWPEGRVEVLIFSAE